MQIELGKEYKIKREGFDEDNYIDVWVASRLTDETVKLLCVYITDDNERASIDLAYDEAKQLRDILNACVDYIEKHPPECFRCGHVRHTGCCVNIRPGYGEADQKGDV